MDLLKQGLKKKESVNENSVREVKDGKIQRVMLSPNLKLD